MPDPVRTVALALMLSGPALAADVTDMPDAMRGDVHMTYGGSYQTGGLDEADLRVGRRTVQRHDMDLRAEFAPIDGVAVYLGLPITASLAYTFPAASQMLFDPVDGGGTYINGAIIEGPTYRGGGVTGFWIGAAFAPLSEQYKRHFGITWRLDLAYRTPAPKGTLYTGPEGSRGAAPGGHGLFIGAAFSTDKVSSNPYLDFEFQWESPAEIEVSGNDGTVYASDLRIFPAAHLDLTAGVELIGTPNTKSRSRVAVDLFTGFGYRTWEDVPSGFSLPSVLDSSRSLSVTRSDYVLFKLGWGVDYDINKWIGLRTSVEGRYFTPHQLENIYAVRTSYDTFEVAWTLGVVGRIRTADD